MTRLLVLLFLLSVPGMVSSKTTAQPTAPPAPTGLQQRDEHGEIPPGELVGASTVVLRFTVVGQPGDLLQPQVELRPVSESFGEANLFGSPVFATGAPQVVEVPTTGLRLAYSGYHWRARVTDTGGISAWSTYGDNLDDVRPPAVFAGADFYNLYEHLFFDDEPAVGFESLVRVARLPRILPGVQTFQVSSFDRTEGNTDGGSNDPGLESYFYREGDAEVVLEAAGPGQISRIWFAESNDAGFANTRIQFFFDGADQISYEIRVSSMVSGTTPPFVAPLVLNADRSSGGLISYVPIPFREGVKVRLIGPHVHYQITYQLLAAAGDLQTFTGLEDYTLAQHLWQRLGQDPKPTRGNLTETATGQIPPGGSLALAQMNGCGVLNSLRLRLPQLEPSILGTPPLDDTVRAHRQGGASFTLTPLYTSAPSRLHIRRSCRETPQVADVFLDGALAGRWSRTVGNDRYRWCEDTFDLPALATPAGTPLSLRIASVEPEHAWEEARYWLDQRVGLQWQAVDELDVGDADSETTHAYQIEGQTAAGWRTATYPPQVQRQPASEALLAGLRLRITADGHTAPDVDVPVGAFFGSGVGEANIATLLAGMVPETDELVSFWPMPYASRLSVVLYNGSALPVQQAQAEVTYARRCYPGLGRTTGYFKIVESLSRPTALGVDHPLINVSGAGKLVGLHLLIHDSNEGLIEGDERWHVDGARTPQVRGTGTEDIFNSGWYYGRGRLITALHGANSTRSEGWLDQFRWYVGDSIPFAGRLTGGVEHGGLNDANADYSSWTAIYAAPANGVLRQDEVNLDDPASMAAHTVSLSGSTVSFTLAALFEGDDETLITGGGYSLAPGAALTATLAVDPDARQVLLRRRYDQGHDKEALRVWINGQWAGDWLDGGRNIARRWRESVFQLPPRLTQNQTQLQVRLEPLAWGASQSATMARLAALSVYRNENAMWLPLVSRKQ